MQLLFIDVKIFIRVILMQVIEMSGVCAASDIWSVGCTVIELLTCVPPYYDLQPMPALFRIVQVFFPPAFYRHHFYYLLLILLKLGIWFLFK